MPLSVSKHLPSILLLCVAAHQMLKAQTENLTSWKGGGFGMFATLDQERFAKVYVSREGQFFPVSLSSDETIVRKYRKSLALPTKENAEAFSKQVHEEMQLSNQEQALTAVFFVDFLQATPRKVSARAIHMVSSRPGLSRGKLVWKW